MNPTRVSTMRKGDCFVGRVCGRPYKITGWYKDGECPLVVALDGAQESSIFAGCATPYGPFSSANEAVRFAQEGR